MSGGKIEIAYQVWPTRIILSTEMEHDLEHLAKLLQAFNGADLTTTISRIEDSAGGLTANECGNFLHEFGATEEVLKTAGLIKFFAGQINVVIHALGILRCLSHILEEGETVECLSLGAGNTGKDFDLETNLRVAEFKFIHWRGGPESIRQNSLFKDFFLLAESDNQKRKFLYTLGTKYPMKFFHGGRAMKSVLTKDNKIRELFYAKYGDRFPRVRDYYQFRQDEVAIVDVSSWLPELLTEGNI